MTWYIHDIDQSVCIALISTKFCGTIIVKNGVIMIEVRKDQMLTSLIIKLVKIINFI